MFKFIRSIFTLWAERERLFGQNLWLQTKVDDLAAQVAILESEKKELMDWLLEMNGAPRLYGVSTTKPVVQEQVVNSPLRQARNMRDYQSIANQMLAEANRPEPRHPSSAE